MEAEKFIKEIRKWDEKEKGMFDYNGVISLLKDYRNEIEKEHLEKTQIRVHGEALDKNKFEELTKPILKYLCENYHPHVTVIITPTSAELLEGLKTIGYVDEFVRD